MHTHYLRHNLACFYTFFGTLRKNIGSLKDATQHLPRQIYHLFNRRSIYGKHLQSFNVQNNLTDQGLFESQDMHHYL